MKRMVSPEMCELYNIFLKSYNTFASIAAQLYIVVLEWKEDDKIGKEQPCERGKGNKKDKWQIRKKDKQLSLIK